ncbi:hypothetical protein D2E23_0624 [Bifidobacterium callimiconis]|uniref:Uncharacterized protein n=1 Tax=Bifidobacterium callimiconis TaxID=2306973 RepID=A0A430FGR8_9BIFI|nr:hypothetical protein D2E23_0624 [Bifidobacterium callimiconis]
MWLTVIGFAIGWIIAKIIKLIWAVITDPIRCLWQLLTR